MKHKVETVKLVDMSNMLETSVERGAPTGSNDMLRWTKRMFDYAIKRHIIQFKPASAFELSDAGGKEEVRDRALNMRLYIQGKITLYVRTFFWFRHSEQI